LNPKTWVVYRKLCSSNASWYTNGPTSFPYAACCHALPRRLFWDIKPRRRTPLIVWRTTTMSIPLCLTRQFRPALTTAKNFRDHPPVFASAIFSRRVHHDANSTQIRSSFQSTACTRRPAAEHFRARLPVPASTMFSRRVHQHANNQTTNTSQTAVPKSEPRQPKQDQHSGTLPYSKPMLAS